jgi:thiosulfate/3-mercaptopyruvate sulfurtransferase
MVSVKELAAGLGAPELVLLDVRPMERFKEGHIPTARQLYRSDYSAKVDGASGISRSANELQSMLRSRGVSEDSVVVAYTDGGPESYRLWWTLKDITGYEIRVLDGGLQQWKADGHGIAGGSGLDVEPGDVEIDGDVRTPKMWATISGFLENNPKAALLDTRSAAEFDGTEHNKKAARAGRIPGSTHVEWYAAFRDTGDRESGEGDENYDYRLMPRDTLDAFFTDLGVKSGAPVVTYCQSGTRSSAIYFALVQRGHDPSDIVNYDGSWAEYSRLDLPAEP